MLRCPIPAPSDLPLSRSIDQLDRPRLIGDHVLAAAQTDHTSVSSPPFLDEFLAYQMPTVNQLPHSQHRDQSFEYTKENVLLKPLGCMNCPQFLIVQCKKSLTALQQCYWYLACGMPQKSIEILVLSSKWQQMLFVAGSTQFDGVIMSSPASSIMLPTRVSLIALLALVGTTIAQVFTAAYSRADDIEPFGL